MYGIRVMTAEEIIPLLLGQIVYAGIVNIVVNKTKHEAINCLLLLLS